MYQWDYVLDAERVDCSERKRHVPNAEQKVPNTKRNGVSETWTSAIKSITLITEVYTSKEKKLVCVPDVGNVKHCTTLYFAGFAKIGEEYTEKKNVFKMKN